MDDPETDTDPRFASTEAYYETYRPDYPEEAVVDVADRVALDTDAKILDLGCGTGRLAVAFAPRAGRVIGMDPDPMMLAHARERAERAGNETVEWVEGSDADLGGQGPLRLTTVGRAFHWMEQERTLDRLYEMTETGGGIALFGDTEWLTRGTAAWQAVVYDVASEFVDDLPDRTGPISYEEPWTDVLAGSRFEDVETRVYERERTWTVDQAVGYALSLSYCSPADVGDVEAFERAIRTRPAAHGEEPFTEQAAYQTETARRLD